jgi:hypothetical protein
MAKKVTDFNQGQPDGTPDEQKGKTVEPQFHGQDSFPGIPPV